MRKNDEDWVNKSIEMRVEGRRPVGRPRKTWSENGEADMAELENDINDRKKWKVIGLSDPSTDTRRRGRSTTTTTTLSEHGI